MRKKISEKRCKCTYCNKTCDHTVCYSKQSVEHRRCSECGEISVFGYVTAEGKRSSGKKEWKLLDFSQVMKRRSKESSSPYLTHTDYTDGDYLDHPQFGGGYVLHVLPPRKMKVLFDGQSKLLICGAGSPK